jgi:hypothetical protein
MQKRGVIVIKVFEMPPDTREKEKIIGGLIDFSQLIWLAIGLGACAIVVIVFYNIIGLGSAIIGFPFIVGGCIFAFKKKEDMMLFTYIVYKIKFNHTIKTYTNKGFKDRLDFTGENKEQE